MAVTVDWNPDSPTFGQASKSTSTNAPDHLSAGSRTIQSQQNAPDHLSAGSRTVRSTVNTRTSSPANPYADAIGNAPDHLSAGDRTVVSTVNSPSTTAPPAGGGSSSTVSKIAPSGPMPWGVATKNGIPPAEVNTFLNKALVKFNAQNGTNFKLNSSGHIRQDGSGGWMSQSQHDAFLKAIPVNAVDHKYDQAIDKALSGDATDIKNLDKFFFGAERPAGGYSKEYLLKEKEARGMGITVAELDKRNAAKAAAAAKPKEAAPIASTTTVQSDAEAESQAAKKPEPTNEEESENKDSKSPNVAVAGASNSGNFALPSENNSSNNSDKKEDENLSGADRGNSEEHRKDAEAHAKAAAAQAEADEKKQQVLAIASANKQSAKEDRLKKIMEMRKPYMGGAASVNGSSDAMVVPPITPASQVPPPPLP